MGLGNDSKFNFRSIFYIMDVNSRTGRIEMHFTEKEIETLAWLVKSEIKVQELLIDESNGTLLKELQEMYESLTW